MATATQALPSSAPPRNLLEDMSSNVSSPLSEVEDKDGQTPEMAMSVNEDAIEREDSDSDSNLSDVAETEAETERLYDTPRNDRYKDVIVDQFNQDHVYKRFSRASARTSSAKHYNDVNDDGELSELDRPSPMSQLTINETPTKDGSSRRPSPNGHRPLKRSRTPDHNVPIVVEPASDRPESSQGSADRLDEDVVMGDDDGLSLPPPPSSAPQSVAGDDDGSRTLHLPAPPLPDKAIVTRETRGSRKITRTRSRRNTVGPPDDDDGSDGKGHDDFDHRQVDDEGDGEAEHVDKSAAEAEKKQAAFEEWTSIDGMFGVFADRLYKDRLAKLEEEETALLADEPTHAEYLAMLRCLDERLEKKLAQAKKEHEFQVAAVARVDHAQRSQIWSQYYQEIREVREETLESLNQQWYDIQAARRTAHNHTDQVLLFPKDPAQRTRNALSYNSEVTALAAVAKHEGFPSAPTMRGATIAETDSDLETIRRAKRMRQLTAGPPLPPQLPLPLSASTTTTTAPPPQTAQPPLHQQPLDSFPATTGLLARDMGPAGEQYIRDNAWANPKHPAHKVFGGPQRTDGRSRSPFVPNPAATAPRQPAFGGGPAKPPTTNGIPPSLVSGPLDPPRVGGAAPSRPARASPIPDLSRPVQRLPAARS